MKYIIRLDDIAQNMNWDNFLLIKDLLVREGIKPIIGVVPNLEDEKLLKYPKREGDFWRLIRHLQNDLDWTIALHGCTHKFVTSNGGILKLDMYSEFAGVPYKQQFQKIKKGKKIFLHNGITTDVFMPPAHSFDDNTLKALENNQIHKITDGYGFLPYYLNAKRTLLVPIYLKGIENIPFTKNGIVTYVIHLNKMSKRDIFNLGCFIHKNAKNIVSFPEIENYRDTVFILKAWNGLVRGYYLFKYFIKSIVNPHTLQK